MLTRQTVIPFRGKLPEVIKRKLGKTRKLTQKEIEYRESRGLKARKTVRTRRKELDGLLSIYEDLISPNTLLITLLGKANRNFKKYKAGLISKFDKGVAYLRRDFADDMSEGFVQDVNRMRKEIEELEEFLIELSKMKTPIDDRVRRLKKFVRKPMYRTRVLEGYSELLESVFRIIGIEVATKVKKNTTLNIQYIQFSIPSKLESALNKSSKDKSERFEVLQRAVDIQQKELEISLEREGFVLMKTRDYLGEGGSASIATVAYDPQVKSVGPAPKKPAKRKGETQVNYDLRVEESGYNQEMKAWQEATDPYIRGIYSPLLRDEETSVYTKFETKDEYKEAYVEKRKKQIILSSQMPTVEEEKIQVGVKEVKKRDGTIEEKPVYDYLSKITYSDGEDTYPLHRYEVGDLEGDVRVAQVTDRSGEKAQSITRVVQVKSMVIGSDTVDVIVEGKYKGFLLDDIVNATGRLVEGNFFTRTASGSIEKLEVLDDVYDFDEDEEKNKTIRDTGDDEVSFLEIGKGSKGAKYQKVVRNRLREPYITLSSDKKRLILGLPNSDANKQDRNNIKKLAKILPGLEQKKDPRLAPTVNGLNPFYYFDAPSYESIRDTLGSVAISKGALDFLEAYYKELTARDRALNEENLKNFTSQNLGGFVSEVERGGEMIPFRFNNKQKEAMAWMEANEYSGMMALDTGVGKTLLAGGAMRHFIKTKEAVGSTKKFLFVSPKRLQGNFTKEMMKFMTDHEVVKNRIEEMNYTKFAKIVRGVDRIEEFLSGTDAKKKEKQLRDIPVDAFEDPNKPEKGLKYNSATAYFKDKYAICFFDEVNEALTGTKRKAISDLKHPRKVLLTASAMEKDPLDLFRFVAIAKGDTFSKDKERAFAERFGNIIGGRFVGLKSDPQVRQEFNTWVKANAYFAFKQDVDFEEMGMPQLQVPTSQVITVAMDDDVEKEYRKLAKNVARELKAMVKKYRDVIKGKGNYNAATFGQGKKAIQDFANSSLKKIKDLITLSTNPSAYKVGDTRVFQNKTNPKLVQAEKILLDRPNKAICYFCSDGKVVKENAKKCSNSGVGGIHVALLDKAVEFYRAGKMIGKIEQKTGKTEISRIEDMTRRLASGYEPIFLDYAFISNHAKGGKKYMEQTKDLIELVHYNLFDYRDALEDEERDEVQGALDEAIKLIRNGTFVGLKGKMNSLSKVYYKKFDFIADQWAVGATKKIFKQNPNIKTLSCTDAYARGYNFQFIGTVVHLDRGKGFDSEEVKQRTARAYRTGQENQVEVIYLDSVIKSGGDRSGEYGASEGAEVFKKDFDQMTIDEIKDLVQGADQDFFMDIISQGMAQNLVEGYESVERTTGKTIATNKNLFAQLLDPTAETLNSVEEALRNEENNPLTTLCFDPERFFKNPDFAETVGNDLEKRALADLTGLSSISEYQFAGGSGHVEMSSDQLVSEGSLIEIEVDLQENLDKTRTIYNKNLNFSPCLPKDAPARLVFGQVKGAMVDKNVSCIKADTKRDHMTLPSLGFDTEISLPFLGLEDEMISDEKELTIKQFLEDNSLILDNGRVMLSSLFLVTDRGEMELLGQDWWRENGHPLVGLKLSLNPNRTSMKVLNAYFKKKCGEYNIDIREYFTQPVEPFDVDSPDCWAVFLRNEAKKPTELLIKAIKTYKEEFKLAYYSNDQVRLMTPPTLIRKFRLKEQGFGKVVSQPSAMQPRMIEFKQADDSSLQEAWFTVSKEVVRASKIEETLKDQGVFSTEVETPATI
tara:strand:+ start:539 stop:5782 length:5244 start_codon:yes stop_codon:yes gene_type:complete